MKPEIRFALSIAGVPAATIAEIEKALPALAELVAMYEKAKPDIDAVLPALRDSINFIKGE